MYVKKSYFNSWNHLLVPSFLVICVGLLRLISFYTLIVWYATVLQNSLNMSFISKLIPKAADSIQTLKWR